LTGTIQGVDVDATLAIYQRHQADSVEVSGFLREAWVQDGDFLGWIPWDPRGLSVDGTFVGPDWDIVVEQPALGVRGDRPGTTLLLTGTWAADSFQVAVKDEALTGALDLGVLTAVKVP